MLPSLHKSSITFAPWSDMERITLGRPGDLTIDLLPNGLPTSIRAGGILINQILGVPPEGAPFGLWLRSGGEAWPCLNPALVTGFGTEGNCIARWTGAASPLAWTVTLDLDSDRSQWCWRIEVSSTAAAPVIADMVIAQDVGLAIEQHLRSNEQYNSHYLDVRALEHPVWGPVPCIRQNLVQPGNTNPWLALACPTGAAAYATDAIDVVGRHQRLSGKPALADGRDLPSIRRQGEYACLALQSQPLTLRPGADGMVVFALAFAPDHPGATSPKDLEHLLDPIVPRAGDVEMAPVPQSIWDSPDLVHGTDPSEADWQHWFPERRHEEFLDGHLAACFTGEGTHVVGFAKEAAVERSHGHVLLGSRSWLPDENAFGVTAYAPGVFQAQLFCGNPNFGRLLTVVRDGLHRLRSSGQRVWVQFDHTWRLLGTPSWFVMEPSRVTWIYLLKDRCLQIELCALADPSATVLTCRVESGDPVAWRLTHQFALDVNELDHGGQMSWNAKTVDVVFQPDPDTEDATRYPNRWYRIAISPASKVSKIAGDRAVWNDGVDRGAPFLVIETEPLSEMSVCMSLATGAPVGSVLAGLPYPAWRIGSGPSEMMAQKEVYQWLRHDAWIHLAAPHGLEQYGGAAWGVRDVCQGPFEWLIAEQRYGLLRDILVQVFSQQSAQTGQWPQWFMLGRYRDIRQCHCHGDIMFWPVKALCDYAEAANDPAILDLHIPWTDDETGQLTSGTSTLREHAERVIELYHAKCLPGTALVTYGDGDWDDTLQPAHPELRKRMVSAWTVQLAFQVFSQLAELYRRSGLPDAARGVDDLAGRIEDDVRKHLFADGVIAGFALHDSDGFSYLLHRRDNRSGIHHRLLPMTRGILSGLFNLNEADAHRRLIRDHLRFPDGVRLMDRPVNYQGGLMTLFQRAETSAYFGREVALQYVHAHLRYAEAMARLGDGDEAWWALQVVNPIGLPDRLAHAAPRQSNVYFSSSDGDFATREQAQEAFHELKDVTRAVKSGWRLYSSGPGLYVRIVRSCLFGIREVYDTIRFDPVLPVGLLPCSIEMEHEDRAVTISFIHGAKAAFRINGEIVDAIRETDNPYRRGGWMIDRAVYRQKLDRIANLIEITLT